MSDLDAVLSILKKLQKAREEAEAAAPTDKLQAGRALPFINAAVDALIGYSKTEHTLISEERSTRKTELFRSV